MRLLVATLLLLVVAPAEAQQGQGMSQAMVVSSCGGGVLPSGALTNLTMNPQGQLCLTGIGGGGPTSVWSASDATANGMTLSNGGKTVTPAGVGPAWQTIRGTIGKTSGKLYVEFYNSIVPTSQNIVYGLASSGFNSVDYLGNNPYSAGIWPPSFTFVSAGFIQNYQAVATVVAQNDVYALAVDFSAGKIWLGKNNVWLNSSNPATGSLPALSFVPATVGALFPGMSFNSASLRDFIEIVSPQIIGGVWTIQPNAASQTYAPPSGFSAWDAP